MVILTDGMENASTEWTQKKLFKRISKLRKAGWTFVFLGANQDSYEAGAGLAMAAGNVSNFRADSGGTAAAYAGLSRTVGEWRVKARASSGAATSTISGPARRRPKRSVEPLGRELSYHVGAAGADRGARGFRPGGAGNLVHRPLRSAR